MTKKMRDSLRVASKAGARSTARRYQIVRALDRLFDAPHASRRSVPVPPVTSGRRPRQASCALVSLGVLLGLLLTAETVSAGEWYAELFGGLSIPQMVGVSNLHAASVPSRQSVAAGVFGMRVGAFKGDTFGAEVEYLRNQPSLMQRTGTVWPTGEKVFLPGNHVTLHTLSFLGMARYEWAFIGIGPHITMGSILFDNCEDFPCGPGGGRSHGQKTLTPALGWTIKTGLHIPISKRLYASLIYEIQSTRLGTEGPGTFPASNGTPFNGAGERFDFMRQLATVGVGVRF